MRYLNCIVVVAIFGTILFSSCGSRGSKSGSQTDTLSYVVGLNVGHTLMEMDPNIHCVCFRKYSVNLLDSVYAQFEFTINEKLRPIAHNWVFKKSPLKIIRQRPNGRNQQILFRGLDDPQKVKSIRPPHGYFGLLWFEELAEMDGMQEVRSVQQSVMRGGHRFTCFCSFKGSVQ